MVILVCLANALGCRLDGVCVFFLLLWSKAFLFSSAVQLVLYQTLFFTGGSLTKLAYYSTVQHKVAKVRSFDHSTKVIILY